MLRDEIKQMVEETANNLATRVEELIQTKINEVLHPEVKSMKRKGKTKAKGIQIPALPSITTGTATHKRKYTRSPKAVAAAVKNIAKAREARVAKAEAAKAATNRPPIMEAPTAS